jgi:hypothetical protein
MSVSLLTSGSKILATLSDTVSFGSMTGQTLNLQTLNVDTVTANKILLGEDTIPDIYLFGVVPPGNLLGTTGVVGSTTGLTQITGSPFTINPSGSGPTWSDASGNFSQLTLFDEPVYYALPNNSTPDPLNPFVGLSVTLGRIAQTSPTSTLAPTSSSNVTVCAPFYILNSNYTPDAAGGSTGTTNTVNGAWFGLINPSASGLLNSGYASMLYSYYVAGCPAATPPSSWSAPVGTGYQVGTGNNDGSGNLVSKTYTIPFSGGIVGSAAVFPPYNATTTYVNLNQGSLLSASPVYPVNSTTPATVVATLNSATSVAPGAATGGIWIQQIWWVSNPTSNGNVVVPSTWYNATHLFTVAGNNTSTITNAAPLNTITGFQLSNRGLQIGRASCRERVYA